jgi:hypothetical protein
MQEVLPVDHRLTETYDKESAQAMIDEGSTIVARTLLTSHSGRGIVLSPPDSLPDAPLYTELKQGPTINEYRVWFGPKGIIDVAQKKRWRTARLHEAGIDPDELYGKVVRAHKNGWVFAFKDMQCTNEDVFVEITEAAKQVIGWGCVDVLIDSESEEWWIVETNSAPGMSSKRTRAALVNCFMNEYYSTHGGWNHA